MDVVQSNLVQKHWVPAFAGTARLETLGYNQLPYLRMYARFTTCVSTQ